MARYARIIVIAELIMACVVIVGGCWGRTEVDDLALVMAIGLDKGEDDTVYVTLQMAVPRAVASGGGEGGRPGEGGGNEASLITTIRGRSILGLIDIANTYINRRPSFVHCKLVVIGEDLAERGLAPHISELVRFHEIRRTMFLVIAKGTAQEFIMANKPILEQNPAKNLELLALASRKAGLIPSSQLHRFLVEMQSLGEGPLVILAGVNEEPSPEDDKQGKSKGGPQISVPISESDIDYIAGKSPSIGGNPIELAGAAVFRGDKMVGEITGEEVRYVLYLRGIFKRGVTIVQDPFAYDQFIAADLRLARPTQIRVTRDGNRFHISVKILLEGGLIGSQGTEDYTDPKVVSAVEEQLIHQIERGCRDIIRKAQTRFSSDIFAFGNKARHLTLTWKEWQNLDWPNEFPQASVSVTVGVELRRTGLLFRSPTPLTSPQSPAS